jgi:hypothetical protein
MPLTPDPKRVLATPEKRFFISMIVKDIELIPAILDLVDNSIDGAKRLTSQQAKDRFKGLHVHLTLDPERFIIVDNCGGITAQHARDYAFRFGRPKGVHGADGEVGQFGVGMKRALFKLGAAFWIESTSERSSFVLPVDVDEWADDDHSTDWTFEFEEVDETTVHPASELGTTIEVTKLRASVSQDFENDGFLSRLRSALELRHQEALQQGIELKLNDVTLRPIIPVLRLSTEFRPIHIERSIGDNGGSVKMALFAGVETQEADDPDDDSDAEAFRQQSKAGWYLFCNDRLLLAADQTALTGWGSAAAAYHPQYRLFRGYVYLTADNSALLPWNTTKTGVDEDSAIFRQVQSEMWDALRMVQAVLNRAKKERQERDPDDRPVLSAMTAATAVRIRDLPISETFSVPDDPPPPRPRRTTSNTKRIAYNVDLSDFTKVAAELGTESAPDVGRKTFSYFYEHEVPEE